MTWFALLFGGLLSQLSSPDYLTRESAHQRLRDSGIVAVPALLVYAPPDAEGEWRRQELLRPWRDTYADVGAVLFVCRPGPGWCRAEDAGWFLTDHRYLAIDRLARRAGTYPPHARGPWDGEWLHPAERVLAAGNYVRGAAIGRPIKWAVSWRSCLEPDAIAARP